MHSLRCNVVTDWTQMLQLFLTFSAWHAHKFQMENVGHGKQYRETVR